MIIHLMLGTNKNKQVQVFGQENFSQNKTNEIFSSASMQVKRNAVKTAKQLAEEVDEMFSHYAEIADDFHD